MCSVLYHNQMYHLLDCNESEEEGEWESGIRERARKDKMKMHGMEG